VPLWSTCMRQGTRYLFCLRGHTVGDVGLTIQSKYPWPKKQEQLTAGLSHEPILFWWAVAEFSTNTVSLFRSVSLSFLSTVTHIYISCNQWTMSQLEQVGRREATSHSKNIILCLINMRSSTVLRNMNQ
jgi:hypothetical protein